jgi:ABC-type dipeptide/oligopeptide/nickel transport system ATPase component
VNAAIESARPLVSIRHLRLEALTARGTAHILRGIDLDIGKGRIVGVVGESGSGKSSLAACLLRLLPANVSRLDGEILFDGVDLVPLREPAMNAYRGARIAMIFQDPMTALNPLFTVGTHLRDVLRRRHPGMASDEARRRSIAALSSVGIADAALRLDSYPHQLSGGMRQRVMISMAPRRRARPAARRRAHDGARCHRRSADRVAAREPAPHFLRLDRLHFTPSRPRRPALRRSLRECTAGTIVESGPVDDVLGGPRHPYTRRCSRASSTTRRPAAGWYRSRAKVPDPVDAARHVRIRASLSACARRMPCRDAGAARGRARKDALPASGGRRSNSNARNGRPR